MKIIKLTKKAKVYLLISFAWTWICWIVAYLVSIAYGLELSLDSTIFNLATRFWGNKSFLPQLMFSLAVYGPLIGFLLTSKGSDVFKKTSSSKNLWHFVLLIPVVSILPSIILSFSLSLFDVKGLAITSVFVSVLLYFLSNIVTSGTEEFGWRGVLYPEMKKTEKTFWDISLKGGLLWALWHYPLLFIMYVPMGIAVLVPSLVGFTASIVAMNYISNFIYEMTHSILSVVVLHALNNTMSFVLMLLFPNTPFLLVSSIMAWVIVSWIEKKYPKIIV